MLKTNIKTKLKRLGFRLIFGGTLMTVLGTALQLYYFIASEGRAPDNSQAGMIFSGIVAALGILILFSGALLRMIGTFDQDKENTIENGNTKSPEHDS